MKKTMVLVLAVMLVAIGVSAGVRYSGSLKIELPPSQRGQMKQMSPEEKSMMRSMGMDLDAMQGYNFEAMADGGHFKMVYTSSFVMFKKGSYVLGNSGKKVAYFVFPDRRQYVKMDMDKMQDAVSDASRKAKMTYSNLEVSVIDLAPKVISGLPCRGKRITVSYDLSTSMMGFHHRSHEKRVTDYYTTSKYDAMSLFGGHNWHSGVYSVGYGSFDKVIANKVGFLGFPVRAKTTTYTDGKEGGTTTLNISNVRVGAISPSTFRLPVGYTQTTMTEMAAHSFGGSRKQGDAPPAKGTKKKRPSLKDILSGFNQ